MLLENHWQEDKFQLFYELKARAYLNLRRKGYAGEMLKLLLVICREYGEKKVLLTCDKSNDASRLTIVKNGGELENEVKDEVGLGECGIIQRYWITL